jgi:hypothetical protein
MKVRFLTNNKTAVLFLVIFTFFCTLAAGSTGNEGIKQKVVFLPIHNLTGNDEYAYLSSTIYNIIRYNFKNQSTLDLIDDENTPKFYQFFDINAMDMETIAKVIYKNFQAETCITGEYYIDREKLFISIKVMDVTSLRIKRGFVETLPADSEMKPSLEKMGQRIAVIVAQDLPPLARDALVEKQIGNNLREKISSEESLLSAILSRHNEIQAVLFSGIHLGRTVISWSEEKPLLVLPIGLEYSCFVNDLFHIRAGVEYLFFDLIKPVGTRSELGLDFLFGVHTQSLFSVSFDTGFAVTLDNNDNSMALAATNNTKENSIQRISLSIPLQLGFSIYFDPSFFVNLRLKSYLLTYTIETTDPSHYEYGQSSLLYSYGFSPFTYLCLSISAGIGIRF